MRRCVALFLITSLFSAGALGAPAKKGKKGKQKEPSGPNMDTGAADPAGQEKSDPGPYKPTGKTGELAEDEEKVEEVEEVLKAKPRDKRLVFLDFLFGTGQAPSPGPANDEQNMTQNALTYAFVLGGSYDLSKTFSLGLRVPWSTATVDVRDSTQKESSMAFGAPQLFFEYRHSLGPVTTLPITFGLGVPLAQGNPDPSADRTDTLPARVNTLADAANGYRDGELYWPKRIPIVVGIGVRHEMKALSLAASTKGAFGINIGEELVDPYLGGGGTAIDNGKLVLYPVAIRSVTQLSVRYDVSSKFWAGVETWLAWNPIEPIEYESTAEPLTNFQWMLEPQIGMRFGKVRPALSFVWPVVGRITDAGMLGARAHVDFAF